MASSIPKTMRAWIVSKNGEPKDALTLNTEWPMPAAPTGPNILIKISHAALNPADVHFIQNIPSWLPFRRNAIPGLDFAGVVVQACPSAPELAVGTEVCASLAVTLVAFGKGSCAEYIVVPSDLVAVKPKNLTPAAAAGLIGVAGQTAHIVMREAKVKPGNKVLVNGASGGVGSILVQIAKARGAVVYGVCSAANADMVKRLGADEVIDYTTCDFLPTFVTRHHEKEPFDLIFDTVGDQALFSHSPEYMKPKGIFISIAGGRSQGIVPFVRNKLIPTFLGGTPRDFRILGLAPNGEYAREVAKWAEEKLIKEVPIDSEFPMEELVQAYDRVASRRAKGKVIIKVSS